LKEAGYPQEAESIYLEWKHKSGIRSQFLKASSTPTKIGESFASPTADELLDQLTFERNADWLLVSRDPVLKDWVINYHDVFRGNSLADAAAKMWLYLKKQGLLDKEASGTAA
jgi:hypothetical protein